MEKIVKKWRESHRQQYNEYMLRYYHSHKDKYVGYRKKRMEKDPEEYSRKIKEYNARYRARKKAEREKGNE